ncbi:hypothetical protein SIID45300_01079 [Candidatus Magnetaquicoccaceae bacterium FCR-1]|uniref:Uncharacterized protein n=1 Tax=Candidatus Magnetaquiglobus chichijimensis TaxID=3141448 RepID=A0ABQ0C7A8_9PROT
MTDLPGKRAMLEKQAQRAQQAKASEEAEKTTRAAQASGQAVAGAPPTPAQLDAMQDQLQAEENIILAGKLEQQRKKREQELQRGKPKTIEKVNVEDLKFTREERKVELPERIRKLPKDHPVRLMYEKGFKEKGIRLPGSSYNVNADDTLDIKDTIQTVVKPALVIVVIILIFFGLWKGAQNYQSGAAETRQEIMALLREKQYTPDHPRLKKEFRELYWSNWLPDLQKLLRMIQSMGINPDALTANPEAGSYLEYIKRHNLPFNQTDALEWYSREIR